MKEVYGKNDEEIWRHVKDREKNIRGWYDVAFEVIIENHEIVVHSSHQRQADRKTQTELAQRQK